MQPVTEVRIVTLSLALLLAPILLGAASQAEEGLRPNQIRATHRYDPSHDRVVYGGYSYAAFSAGVKVQAGLAEDTQQARALYARTISGDPSGQVIFQEPDGIIVDFKPASSGRLAVLTVLGSAGTWRKEDPRTATVVMRVLDSDGRPIRGPISNVRDFEWNAAGTYLAYCTGDPDLLRDDFRMTGTWLLHVGTGELRRVSEKGRHVAWNKSEGALYVYSVPGPGVLEEEVLRYDPASNVLSKTSRKGIYFSPSGAYYYRNQSQNYGSFDVFESASDDSVLARSRVLPQLVPQAVGWLPDEDLLLFETWYYGENPRKPEETPHSMLYDPRSDSAVDLGDVAILGYDRTSRAIKWRSGHLEPQAVRDLIRGGTTVTPGVRR